MSAHSPCLPPPVFTRALLASKIQECIPREWKVTTNHIGAVGKTHVLNSHGPGVQSGALKDREPSMLESLLNCVCTCASKGLVCEGFRVLSRIQRHVISSSTSSLASLPRCDVVVLPISSLLEACAADIQFHPQGLQLHGHITRLGVQRYPLLLSRLVTFYSEFNLLPEARMILECSYPSNPLPWNVVISAYVRNGLCKVALCIYQKMLSLGVKPDKFTYPTVLKACGEELNLDLGREVYSSIAACSHGQNLFVMNALISMFGKCGEVDFARQLFEKLPVRDAVSWNTMISLYASVGNLEEAILLFDGMREEMGDGNVMMWNTIAGGFVRRDDSRGALQLLSRMRAQGLHLDHVGTIIGLNACSKSQAARIGREIHAAALRGGCDEYHNVKHALITMYSSCEDLKHAYTVFHMVEDKSIITWNSMISGYSQLGKLDEASFLFREMLLSGVEPNDVTIASILPLCARVSSLQHGREFHCYITKRKDLKDCLPLSNALVDMYAKAGKILHAKRMFDSLIHKNIITYTSLISGYGAQGQGEIALKFFQEMVGRHIKPDEITMVAVLAACSHSGLVDEGKRIFDKMLSEYGIVPTVKHYTCLVDLYGRAGKLDEAVVVIRKMPYQPTPETWNTLVGACRTKRDMELGKWAAKKLSEMRPEKSGYYSLIANMYASAGIWNEQATVRTSMKDLGVRKDPGYATVDIGGIFHSFLSGDTSNEITHEIYDLLEGLTQQMKHTGCSADETLVE